MKEPTLPSPDTHCFDEDTKTDCWSYSSEQMQAHYQKGRSDALEEAALFISGGSFLHDQSPVKMWAN